MTDNFNFKLGRARMNYERKREFVEKHVAELEELKAEFQLMCPHKEVETKEIMVQGNDFYYRNEPHLQVTCKYCGYQTLRKL
jgi:aspartate carbamoyltransferase regulatory subunit